MSNPEAALIATGTMTLPERLVNEVAVQASFVGHDAKRYREVGNARTSVAIHRITKKSLRRDRDQVVGMLRLVEAVLGYNAVPAEWRTNISAAIRAATEAIGDK